MKVRVRIPFELKDKAEDISWFIKALLTQPDMDIEKAIKNPEDYDGEKPICPAEQLITDEMERFLVEPVMEGMKQKVFELAGLKEFVDKNPDDPKYAVLYKSFHKPYEKELRDEYSVEINPKEISEKEANKITETMKLVSHVYKPHTFRIKVKDLGNKLGKWDELNDTMYLAPGIFKEKLMLTADKTINLGQKVLIHEIGHILDHDKKISNRKDWRDISNWSKQPADDRIKSRYNQNGVWKEGKWYHGKQAVFINNYASRNPKEDWAECFAYLLLNAKDLFKLQGADKKLQFVQNTVRNLAIQSSNVL